MTTESVNRDDILIVDDNIINLRVLSSILTHQNYRVRQALNGKLALKAVQSRSPDLIVLDVRMPDMDGYEVCRRLKADPQTVSIPVIFISGLEKTEDIIKGFDLGAVDYISKPFKKDEILARISTHLALKSHRFVILNKYKKLVTEFARLHQLEKNTRRTARYWGQAIDVIPEMVLILDRENQIIQCNSAAARLFDTTPAQMEKRRCYQFYHQGENPHQNCPYLKTIATGEPHRCDIFLPHLSIWLNISVFPLYDDKNCIEGCIHVAHDITNLKKLENECRLTWPSADKEQPEVIKKLSTLMRPSVDAVNRLTDSLLDETHEPSMVERLTRVKSHLRELVRWLDTMRDHANWQQQ